MAEPGPVTFVTDDVPPGYVISDSKTIDDELDEAVKAESSRLTTGREDPPDKSDKPKAGPPKLDDWQDFFSRIIIRSATDWYVNFAFRGIDEDELSDREVNRISLSKEERDRIARPFSELANKSAFTRKHGRTIIAFTDSWDSLVALGTWYSRVSRIARKHQKRTIQGHVSSRSGTFTAAAPSNGHPTSDNEPFIGRYFGPYGTGTG